MVLLDSGADRRWAADTAIELCASWAKSGRRIVLADLHLENPVLHERVGVSNLEGVVDIFVYGASLARSARPVKDRGFYLIPAGTYTPDADAIFAHPRWAKLITGFRDASASLVIFVPEETADLSAIGAWTSQMVILGGATASAAVTRAAARGFEVRAVLVPPGTELEAGSHSGSRDLEPSEGIEHFAELEQLEEYDASADTVAFPGMDFGWAAAEPPAVSQPPIASGPPGTSEPTPAPEPPLISEPTPAPEPPPRSPEPPAASRGSGPEAPALSDTRLVGVVTPEDDEHDRGIELPPPPVRRRPEKRRGVVVLLWLLLATALLAAAGFAASRFRPDLFPWLAPVSSPSQLRPIGAEPPQPAPGVAAPDADPLPYSVQVKAFTSFAAAQEQVATERRRFTEAPLFISPEEIQGILYYRILAGLAQDTLGAVRVRESLVAAGSVDPRDAAGTWSLIQYTPIAFALGEFESPEAAASAADSLAAQEIPAYPVALPYSDGSRRWKLYGGAFRDSTSAEKMRQMLDEAGIEARLVLREGAPAAGEQ